MTTRHAIALLLALALGCAHQTVTIPLADRPLEEAIVVDTKLMSDAEMTVSMEPVCAPDTPAAEQDLCPLGLTIKLHSAGLEGGIVTSTLGLAGAAVEFFGGGPGSSVTVQDGGTLNMGDTGP